MLKDQKRKIIPHRFVNMYMFRQVVYNANAGMQSDRDRDGADKNVYQRQQLLQTLTPFGRQRGRLLQ
ncbi:hypothetical protein EI42_02067 [Thermosporothrix hazakensis]|uniref:Uncharacterized protein n=2 Tax=Thermosporothrix TaxID=768650 RepID=A0A326U8J1_THEHA|nr:hypothetical protein EI42_02067 [Thermosporothrix hazakensis]BBH91486.1 hypothetical protein KTC_62370 [Thermosporothrix sp. COM3]GCE49631.1 hypothetical protein KTH_45000 [Thermosporothrix hazakensis]